MFIIRIFKLLTHYNIIEQIATTYMTERELNRKFEIRIMLVILQRVYSYCMEIV